MEDKDVLELIRKFIRNECSAPELAKVQELIRKGVDESIWQHALQQEEASIGPNDFQLDQEHAKQLYEQISRRTAAPKPQGRQRSMRRLMWPMAAAASLVMGYFLFVSWPVGEAVAPEKIVSTQYHEHRELVLEDSSHIWMNSKSTLRYPERFASAQRKVFLEGEAFFQITKNPDRPFIVQAGNLAIRVLGTSFNIKSFENENQTVVTLATGKVEIEWGGHHPITLVPGERLTYTKSDGMFQKTAVDASESYAWRDGMWQFTSVPLREVSQALERRYGVQVYITDPQLEHTRITFRQRDQDLNEMLDMLAFTAKFSYTIKGDSVLLAPL